MTVALTLEMYILSGGGGWVNDHTPHPHVLPSDEEAVELIEVTEREAMAELHNEPPSDPPLRPWNQRAIVPPLGKAVQR